MLGSRVQDRITIGNRFDNIKQYKKIIGNTPKSLDWVPIQNSEP